MSEKIFASTDYPLRVSAIGKLLNCNWSMQALFEGMISDEAGGAAQTGTLLHAAVEEWHKNSHDAALAVQALMSEIPRNPLGDAEDAIKQFNYYIRDPRNIEANLVLNEHRISNWIPPHPDDRTKEPIYISGRLDQLRRDSDGLLRLYDVKSSGRPPGILAVEYALSQLMYCWLVEQLLNEAVYGASIILTRAYMRKGCMPPESKPTGIFIQIPLTRAHYLSTISQIQAAVMRVRNNEASVNPGEHCNWCGFQSPANCLVQIGLK